MSHSHKEELVITRSFNAPKQLVFDAFTIAEHLKNWWGPAEFTIDSLSLDFKINGTFHYRMTSPDGSEMYGLFTYKEIDKPNKIVFNNSFADKMSNKIKPPFLDAFPLEVQNTWTFDEHDGKTTLTLKSIPITTSSAELLAFADLHEDMNKGTNATIDQLEKYLASKFKIRHELNTQPKPRVCSYFNFNGNTEEAILFYKKVFKGEFVGKGIQRFEDIPATSGHPPIPDNIKKMVLHVELKILGGHILMATDAPESMGFTLVTGNNMHINVEPESRAETDRIFEGLSEGGTITMALEDMFFGAYYGSVTDKYGINWMLHFREIN
jgi:uncharacterized glyoxalase superfamily protein PhnB/uncharacterized protein YndB with AHSA1/START domain